MKTLIIYDSQYGNTKQLAEALADNVRADDAVELIWSSPSSTIDLTGVGLLFLGCPTQHRSLKPAFAYFLRALPTAALQNLPVAVFDTRYNVPRWRSGSAAIKAADELRLKGVWLVVPPESFFVRKQEGPLEPGELLRAGEWARRVMTRVEMFTGRTPVSSHGSPD